MFKQRLIAIVTGIAIMLSVISVSGIVADSLGLSLTSTAYACSTPPCQCNGGSGGGSC